jgi:glutamine amidotransferase
MCRWVAYAGNPIPLEAFLFKADHNLIDQSMNSRTSSKATNGDGFGVGWYGPRPYPGLFRSLRPAWNDFNLRDLAAQIDSRLFFAHVRASTLAAVQETNCHPFRYGRWLFVHNGEVRDIEKLRRDLLLRVDPALFSCIQGTTDSEVMFYLALTFGLEADVAGALAKMAGCVEQAARERGVADPLRMTLGVTDGESIWAVRYASDGNAPSLFHSRDVKDIAELMPDVAVAVGERARSIVSEPIGGFAEIWAEVPQGALLHARDGRIDIRSFAPTAH